MPSAAFSKKEVRMKLVPIALLLTPLALAAGTAAPAQEAGRPISVSMTGAAEVPGPGDADGSGTASFRINPGQAQVCYELSVSGIEPATAAHIHRGAADAAGPVVVPLNAPTNGTSKGCAEVDRALAKELIQTPAAFYVNVHNAPHPAGAVRGQLGK
jgi:hypothetical protein